MDAAMTMRAASSTPTTSQRTGLRGAVGSGSVASDMGEARLALMHLRQRTGLAAAPQWLLALVLLAGAPAVYPSEPGHGIGGLAASAASQNPPVATEAEA